MRVRLSRVPSTEERRAFYARGPFPPGVVPVVRGLRTHGDDQRIVFEAGAVSEPYALGKRIEIDDLTQQDARIVLAAQDAAQRCGNLTGQQRAGRDLIQERLKEVIIASINERHLDGR
jgi:hypothetical protein